jgi:hypothetical protein
MGINPPTDYSGRRRGVRPTPGIPSEILRIGWGKVKKQVDTLQYGKGVQTTCFVTGAFCWLKTEIGKRTDSGVFTSTQSAMEFCQKLILI